LLLFWKCDDREQWSKPVNLAFFPDNPPIRNCQDGFPGVSVIVVGIFCQIIDNFEVPMVQFLSESPSLYETVDFRKDGNKKTIFCTKSSNYWHKIANVFAQKLLENSQNFVP
jgi:hypothetical protein